MEILEDHETYQIIRNDDGRCAAISKRAVEKVTEPVEAVPEAETEPKTRTSRFSKKEK